MAITREFRLNLLGRNIRVPGLLCGIVFVLVRHRLVTDGRTDTGLQYTPCWQSVALVMMVMSHEVDTSNYQVLLRHVVATVYSVTYVALCYRMLAFALL